jgi:hypothetical protein
MLPPADKQSVLEGGDIVPLIDFAGMSDTDQTAIKKFVAASDIAGLVGMLNAKQDEDFVYDLPPPESLNFKWTRDFLAYVGRLEILKAIDLLHAVQTDEKLEKIDRTENELLKMMSVLGVTHHTMEFQALVLQNQAVFPSESEMTAIIAKLGSKVEKELSERGRTLERLVERKKVFTARKAKYELELQALQEKIIKTNTQEDLYQDAIDDALVRLDKQKKKKKKRRREKLQKQHNEALEKVKMLGELLGGAERLGSSSGEDEDALSKERDAARKKRRKN